MSRRRPAPAAAAHLTTAREMGRKAYERGDVAVPAADPHLTDLTAALPPAVGSGAADLYRAWLDGWTAANLTADPEPTPPDPQPLTLFHAPDTFGTLDLFPED